MIRHRPFGIGHPYRIELDQRVPPVPIAGEPFELRAITDTSVRSVQVEVVSNGQMALFDALPFEPESVRSTGQGHLTSAAKAGAHVNQRFWIARPDPLIAASEVRYRFVADGHAGRKKTRWFVVSAARWQADGGRLVFEPSEPGRLVQESVEWLVGVRGAIRVRFALGLEPGEHVVGFGERFDAMDQRGRALDAVVYEQYKGQGNRTYLPMPFAIVAGGDGWGFTSRRHVERGLTSALKIRAS